MWKIKEGGFVRFTNANTNYVLPSNEQKMYLSNFLQTEFNLDIKDVKKIVVSNNFLDHGLSILTYGDRLIVKKYEETMLPDELNFYKYKFVKTNDVNDVSDDKILCTICYGSSY